MTKPLDTHNGENKVILLVEDSVTQALHLQLLLEKKGLQVAWASTGWAGIEMAQQLHPDLIVLDLQMPDINGFQVCEQLKQTICLH